MTLFVGELAALLTLDADPFEKTLNRVMSASERGTAQRMASVGDSMTRGLTLPLLAAGGAAVKLNVDYNTAFSRMVGLAGVPQAEIEGLKDSVLDLAGETAVAPQELAEALYFIRSAGLEGQDALDALEMSAKGAAAGLGSTVQVADAVTSAMNAYAAEGLTAAQATDALVASAKIGKVEAADLAPNLGRLAGVAQSLGIDFADLASTVGFLSRTNGDASLSTAQFQGVLAKLQSPGEKGKKVLDDIGLSLNELRSIASADGPAAALELLRTKLEATGMEFSDFSEDQQFLQGALALTGDNFRAASEAAEQGRDSIGGLQEAWEAAQRVEGFQMKQGLVDLQRAAIEAGDVIAPFVAKAASGASTVADAFGDMSSTGQSVVVGLAAVVAGAGPVLSIGGRLADVWGPNGKLGAGIAALPGKLAGASSGVKMLAGAGGALVAAGIAVELYRMATAAEEVEVNVQAAARATDEQLVTAFRYFGDVGGAFGDASNQLQMFTDVADGSIGSAKRLRDALAAEGEDVSKLDEILQSAAAAQAQQSADQEAAIPTVEQLAGSTDDLAGAEQALVDRVKEAEEAFQGLLDATLAQFDSNLGYRQSVDAVEGALGQLAETTKQHGTDSEEYRDALMDTEGAMLAQAASALRLAEDQAEAGGAALTAAERSQVYRDELMLIAEGLAPGSPLRSQLMGYAANLDSLPETVRTQVHAETSDAEHKLRTLKILMGELDPVTVRPASSYAGPSYKRASGGPVWAGSDFLVGEEGPEIVRFSGAGHVFDAGTTRQMMAAPPMAATGSSAPASGDLVGELRALRGDFADLASQVKRMRAVNVSVDGLTDRTATQLGAKAGAMLAVSEGF